MAYKTIEASFWQDPDVRQLSNEARLLLLFYITNPSSHFTGIYWIKDYVPANELGWTLETYADALSELKSDRGMDRGIEGVSIGDAYPIDKLSEISKEHFFVRYDDNYSLLWVKSMLRHQVGNKPLNGKQLKGIINHIKQFKFNPLVRDFLSYYRQFLMSTFSHYEKPSPQLKKELEDIFMAFSIGVSSSATAAAAATADKKPTREASASRRATKYSGAQKPLITDEQIEAAYKAFNGTEEKVRQFVANLAAENKSGAIKNARVYAVLAELQQLIISDGPDRFAYGLTEANTRGVPNINYVKKAMQGYGKSGTGGDYKW